MTQHPDSDALRVGDRDREQAVAVLQDAVGGGYIDLGEFEERSQTVFAAKTRGELRAVLMDLPTAAALFPPAGSTLSNLPVGGADTISVDWTTVRRRGRWEVPVHLMITGSMGVADLDLGQALIPATGCMIEVMASWSTIKLRLGEAMIARTDGFAGGSMSTLKDKSGPPTVSGGPVIDIRGHAGWTTVVLRRS
jgi:hypothetical protein